jgi:hypothetical protein
MPPTPPAAETAMVSPGWVDRVNGGPRGAADDVEAARRRPADRRGLGDQLRGGDHGVGGLAVALPGVAEYLVPGREVGDLLAEFGDHTSQVAALTGGERGWEQVLHGAGAVAVSPGLMLAARTSTRTSPAAGRGTGMSARYRTSRSP